MGVVRRCQSLTVDLRSLRCGGRVAPSKSGYLWWSGRSVQGCEVQLSGDALEAGCPYGEEVTVERAVKEETVFCSSG